MTDQTKPDVQVGHLKEDGRVFSVRHLLDNGRPIPKEKVAELLAAYDEVHPGRPDQPGLRSEIDREVMYDLFKQAEEPFPREEIEVQLRLTLRGSIVKGGDLDYVPAAVWPKLATTQFALTAEGKPYVSLRYTGQGHHTVTAVDRIKDK